MAHRHGLRRNLLVAGGGTLAGVLLAGAVLGIEIVLAGRGPRVVEFDPHAADGPVGEPGDGDAVAVVWIGDSTAAGVGASGPSLGLPAQVARGMDRPVRLTVLAVSGARAEDVAVQAAAVPPATDLVVVSAGSNDATHTVGLGRVQDAYGRLLRALPATAAVVVLGVPDIGAATRLPEPLRRVASLQGTRVDAIVRPEAAAHGAAYVDIAGATGAAFRADPDRYLAADGYHPSDAGYGLWRDAVVPVVNRVLAGR
jgi:lysophospholipase L1-like esterase